MFNRVVLGCVLAAGMAAACGGDDGGSECSDADTYESFVKPLFATNCISCHGAVPVGTDVQLHTHDKVKEHEEHVIARAVELTESPTMPYLLDPLPKAERDRLGSWYACGAK